MLGLIAWGRFVDANGNKVTVPAPSTNPGSQWLYDYIHSNAKHIGGSFDIVQWPPISKAQGGSGAGCDGYEVFDPRDLGTKNQQGSVNTRYGSFESFMAAVAALRSYGAQSYGDLVMHQRGGGSPIGTFNYLGADGKTKNGRGSTTPNWFQGQCSWNATTNTWNDPIPPFCKQDDVPVPADNFPFGEMISYQNSNPAGLTIADAKDFVTWYLKRTAITGCRYDDTKGAWASGVAQIMSAAPSLPFYSEYFDGNPSNLNWWATSSPMNSRSAVEDFTLHWRIQAACNGFDATQFDKDGAGYWQWNSDLAVGFVDNPDTDTSPGQQVIFNKGMAYAYMLTLPLKTAMIYGKDYFPSSVWPGAYGLQKAIDNLCWISRMFAFGAYQVRYVDKDVHVATRDGNGGSVGWSGGLLTALNFNVLVERTVTVQTTFGPNRHLHDYTGHTDDVWTDGNGRVTITIPSNAYSNGMSYVCLAPAGVDQPYPTKQQRTFHVFDGAVDLDVLPALNGTHVLPQRVYCKAGTTIEVKLTPDRTGWVAGTSITINIIDPNNRTIDTTSVAGTGPITNEFATVFTTGWHTIQLVSSNLPTTGSPYELSVGYIGA